mgnify:CR=1 FL=1
MKRLRVIDLMSDIGGLLDLRELVAMLYWQLTSI